MVLPPLATHVELGGAFDEPDRDADLMHVSVVVSAQEHTGVGVRWSAR